MVEGCAAQGEGNDVVAFEGVCDGGWLAAEGADVGSLHYLAGHSLPGACSVEGSPFVPPFPAAAPPPVLGAPGLSRHRSSCAYQTAAWWHAGEGSWRSGRAPAGAIGLKRHGTPQRPASPPAVDAPRHPLEAAGARVSACERWHEVRNVAKRCVAFLAKRDKSEPPKSASNATVALSDDWIGLTIERVKPRRKGLP
jgi:hypothetical protein